VILADTPSGLSWIEIIAQVLGTLGFVMAFASLWWQVHTWREGRKEQVDYTLGLACSAAVPEDHLVLKIVNAGMVPIYIREAALWWRPEKPDRESERRSIMMSQRESNKNPIQPGDDREFILILSRLHQNVIVASPPERNMWLTVSSAKGEILRIDGTEVSLYVLRHCGSAISGHT